MGYMLYQDLHVDYKKVKDHAVESGMLMSLGAGGQLRVHSRALTHVTLNKVTVR